MCEETRSINQKFLTDSDQRSGRPTHQPHRTEPKKRGPGDISTRGHKNQPDPTHQTPRSTPQAAHRSPHHIPPTPPPKAPTQAREPILQPALCKEHSNHRRILSWAAFKSSERGVPSATRRPATTVHLTILGRSTSGLSTVGVWPTGSEPYQTVE